MEAAALVKDFLAYNQALGRAPTTLLSYSSTLLVFFKRQDKPVGEITGEDIAAWLGTEMSPRTRRFRHIVLTLFYRWLRDEGRILLNPMEQVARPRSLALLPTRVMSRKEAERVLAVFPVDTPDPAVFRRRLMLELMYTCSLRRRELVELRLNDYTASLRSIQVRQTKNKVDKILPVGRLAAGMLDRYLREFRPVSAHQHLFLDDLGRPVSPNTITELACRARKEAGIRTKATSHSFRKTSATLMLKGGAKIEEVQRLLGHKSILSTQAYTKVSAVDVHKMHAAHHPREKQKNQVLPELKVPLILSGRLTLAGCGVKKPEEGGS